jgi:very-short-patch-repair endonuclease
MKDRIHNVSEKRTLRQKLRNSGTPAERTLWRSLRRAGIGFKFRRQFGIGRYVVDFYCPELKLAVELEGQVHCDVIRAEYDAERNALLASQGIRVLYFENRSVFEWREFVLEAIRSAAAECLL